MSVTEREKLPKVLFEIMRKCLCETDHTTMHEISEMLDEESIQVPNETERIMIDYVLAQEELHDNKHTAKFASARATPSGFLSSVRNPIIWDW